LMRISHGYTASHITFLTKPQLARDGKLDSCLQVSSMPFMPLLLGASEFP
jgi:hypothetical protein